MDIISLNIHTDTVKNKILGFLKKFKRIIRIVVAVSVAGLFICGMIVFVFYTGIIRMNYPSEKQFPVRGIDISHHQQTIMWEQVSHNDVQFVFMKATEGGNFKDPLFLDNWTRAKQNGFVRGAYHFFTFCRSGKAQAMNFIETVPVESGTLPPVLDLEFGGNCQARPSQDALVNELNDFITEIEQVYHRPPLLYITYEAYDTYIKGEFEQLDLWIRDVFRFPAFSDNRAWVFWQYSNRGRIHGIPAYVDLNVFNGNRQDFQRLVQ
ncbi:MAG: glycoside hydrolase family 25 protein [Gammaproteobacteria bacterium]|nr:glycoside hydrolase family 25 protein [Gammaproteobacteria bacterium]